MLQIQQFLGPFFRRLASHAAPRRPVQERPPAAPAQSLRSRVGKVSADVSAKECACRTRDDEASLARVSQHGPTRSASGGERDRALLRLLQALLAALLA